MPIISASLFLSIIISGILNYVDGKSENSIDDSLDVWRKAYENITDSKLGILFDDITTTEEEYFILRNECNKLMDNDITPDLKVSTKVIINEKIFIDGIDSDEVVVESSNNVDTMVETGPIYFQDILLLRYMNSEGNIKILTAILDRYKDEVYVVGQRNIADYLIKSNVKTGITYNNITKDINTSIAYNSRILENNYLKILSDTVISIIGGSNIDDIKSMTIKYFTLEGIESILNSKNLFNIEDGEYININCVLAGKSDISKNMKDRIYMQLEVRDKYSSRYINIVLKLTNFYKVFDIDVL